jgi:hypothetical protein
VVVQNSEELRDINLQYKIEFLQPHNYIYRPLDNAYFQRHKIEAVKLAEVGPPNVRKILRCDFIRTI